MNLYPKYFVFEIYDVKFFKQNVHIFRKYASKELPFKFGTHPTVTKVN